MRAVRPGFLIGELSQRSGLPPQTIRYYEQLGLLNPPARTEARYRVYTAEHLERLAFIAQAKLFGLSLEEIRQLIELRCGGVVPCGHMRGMVQRHIAELDARIRQLTAFRDELLRRYEAMDGRPAGGKICGIVEAEPFTGRGRD